MKFVGSGTIDRMSFFGGVEVSEMYPLSVHFDLGHKFVPFSKESNAFVPCGVISIS
jgi:hypothetical protein